jgi:hypothetical protein
LPQRLNVEDLQQVTEKLSVANARFRPGAGLDESPLSRQPVALQQSAHGQQHGAHAAPSQQRMNNFD